MVLFHQSAGALCDNLILSLDMPARARTPFAWPAGVVTNCNVGEPKNKEQQASASSGSGRDNLEHMWRTTNDSLGIKSLADGVTWTARGWEGRKWVDRTVTAGDLCRRTLQEVFSILPLAPDDSDSGALRAGRPWGFVEWDVELVGMDGVARSDADGARDEWKTVVAATLPSAGGLVTLYKEKLGCGREETGEPCESGVCALCWQGRRHLHNGSVSCFNHWGNAPAEASAGTGTLRGGPVKDAAAFADTWMIQETSSADDVELYVDVDARRSGERGQTATTLGRIAYFFEHQGNDSRHPIDGEVQEGEWTIWVAVQEYVTAGRGQSRKVDPETGCDVFTLRRSFKLFPASCIRSMVHMVHACARTGGSSCGLVRKEGEKDTWSCKTFHGARFLLNKYFHGFGRGPVS